MKKKIIVTTVLATALTLAMGFPIPVLAEGESVEEIQTETAEGALVVPALSAWNYKKDDTNKILYISQYIGSDTRIRVPATYTISGNKYKVVFKPDRSTSSRSNRGVFAPDMGSVSNLQEVFLEDGITGDFTYLFCWCKKLEKANIPSGVTDASWMFQGCTNLSEIDKIPDGVTAVQGMFYQCESLKTAPALPKGITNCAYMFSGCARLVKAPEIPEGVRDCSIMFENCVRLEEPPELPAGVKDCAAMFQRCTSLVKAPDIPDGVYSTVWMFSGCTDLEEAPHNLGTGIEDASAMFENCTKLSGTMNINGKITEVTGGGTGTVSGMFANAATEGSGLTICYAKDVNIDDILATRSADSKITAKQMAENPKPDDPKPEDPKPDNPKPSDPTPVNPTPVNPTPVNPTPQGTKEASYNGYTFYRGADGKLRCYDKDGNLVKNEFMFDGFYTYYMQADGTAMIDRLTYHPDGEHIIYFDQNGHEVFASFAYCPSVGYTCYFDANGFLYKDQITFVGDKVYYLNANGAMEQNGWFRFANGRDYGYANWDGTLMNNGWGYDPYGRVVFYHWNGMVARGLISDGTYYYMMDETDGHYLGQFPV